MPIAAAVAAAVAAAILALAPRDPAPPQVTSAPRAPVQSSAELGPRRGELHPQEQHCRDRAPRVLRVQRLAGRHVWSVEPRVVVRIGVGVAVTLPVPTPLRSGPAA